MNEIKVYTLDEVADILKVSRRTLYTYVKEGKLPACKDGQILESITGGAYRLLSLQALQ